MFELPSNKTRGSATAGSVSLTLHAGALLALWLIWLYAHNDHLRPPHPLPHVSIDLPRFVRNISSGGGGSLTPLPISKGTPPPVRATKVFVLPNTTPQPALPLPVSMPKMDAPPIDAQQYGDPSGALGPLSFGPGGPNGMGKFPGDGGVGPGGPGNGVYLPGHGVTTPILIFKSEPEYSDEARRVKYSGTVHLRVIIDARGVPSGISVVQPVGLGLDEKAVEAVKKWRFRPGMKDGRAVAVEATIEVSFRLL